MGSPVSLEPQALLPVLPMGSRACPAGSWGTIRLGAAPGLGLLTLFSGIVLSPTGCTWLTIGVWADRRNFEIGSGNSVSSLLLQALASQDSVNACQSCV